MKFTNSQQLFQDANSFIPGGVNSPVRAFKAVGGTPVFMKSAKGAFLYDEDGNTFVDLINSWGPMILGHAKEEIMEAVREATYNSLSFGAPTRKEVEMAELISSMLPSVEKVRMVNSGTEATMSALRLARGFTGKNKLIKFEGCYHGHGDSFLIAAGSGAVTFGKPDSPGVPQGVANDTLTAPFNDIAAVELLVKENEGQIAAIILEPVVGNMGCVLPKSGYLEALRAICDREKIVLIFDEVMTGFRLSSGGAQQLFGVKPDLTTMGKIIGGGMPVGAYGGRADIMNFVSPSGPVYQAGTLSGNPVAMSAGMTMLNYLKSNPSVYTHINQTTAQIAQGFKEINASFGKNWTINQIGSMMTLFFTEEAVTDFESAKTTDKALYASYFHGMLNEGIYLAPSQYESWFVCNEITEDIVDKILTAHKKIVSSL